MIEFCRKHTRWALVMLLFIVLLIFLPKIQVFGIGKLSGQLNSASQLEKFNAEDRARQTLATIFGGIAVLAGSYLTWKNVKLAEQSAKESAEADRSNIKIAENKQITDRFTAAVTNLSAEGDAKMAQRLGGIYALERIARDSPEDHWTVMEVLSGFLRDKYPKEASFLESMTDVQAALTVIGRRDTKNDKGRKLNLSGLYLADADLREAKLAGAILRHTILARANLWETDLEGANMERVILEGAHIDRAYLKGAENLTQAQLDKTDGQGMPNSLPPGLTFPPKASDGSLEIPPATS